MNPFQETIKNLMPVLVEKLNVEGNFITYFIKDDILTMHDEDKIRAKETSSEKNTAFLRLIWKKSEKEALRVLLEALRKTAHKPLAKQIEEEYARQTAAARTESPFPTHGSYRAVVSRTVLHLHEVERSMEVLRATVEEGTHSTALVWWDGYGDPPSMPEDVKVLEVKDEDWHEAVGGLKLAESKGHKKVTVVWWEHDIKLLADHIATSRDKAATDIWLLWYHTDLLSWWQQQMDEDSHYCRIN